jgi:hypothetical protein
MKIKFTHIMLLLLFCWGLFGVAGCDDLQRILRNPDYVYEDNAVLVDGADEPIRLINNPSAVNVSFQDVIDFIRRDTTDLLPYVERDNLENIRPFVCSDFAEAVHNNAEAAGIRAAYISLDWSRGGIGHALDAFETTDKGIVFIDCTGESIFSQVEDADSQEYMGSWDKVAYIELGKKYGVIGIAYAKSPEYSFFEEYENQWSEYKKLLSLYNEQVKLFNQEIRDKVFRKGTAEYERIKAWEIDLDAQKNAMEEMNIEIGNSRFRPLYVVSNYEIHW